MQRQQLTKSVMSCNKKSSRSAQLCSKNSVPMLFVKTKQKFVLKNIKIIFNTLANFPENFSEK